MIWWIAFALGWYLAIGQYVSISAWASPVANPVDHDLILMYLPGTILWPVVLYWWAENIWRARARRRR